MAVVTAAETVDVRRLRDASDELMFALEDLDRLIGYDWEYALDELVNVCFLPDEPPRRPDVDPDRLAAARGRLTAAGRAWAETVAAKPRPTPDLLGRLSAALDRIGHQGSPVFRATLARAFREVERSQSC